MRELYNTILTGWQEHRRHAPVAVRPYWESREQLSVSEGIIFKGMRIVIPPSLRPRMLEIIHETHLGMAKCKQRAREVLHWPAMNADVEATVRDCPRCAEYPNKLPPEPLSATPTLDLPFIEVRTELLEFQSKHYILLVDYYSKFVEVDELRDQSSSYVIQALKVQF